MTARGLAIVTGEGGERAIECKTVGCAQVLATINERGDLYPVIMGAYVDREGRYCITCPACKVRNRLPTRRRAA